MIAKLHINISQGIIDVEGDPELVRAIYDDFKEQLLAGGTMQPPPLDESEGAGPAEDGGRPKARSKRKPPAKKRLASDEGGPNVSADSPKLDKNLDTSGLPAFYERYEAKNNPQKILVFLKFMNDELGIENPNTDQFYTCFEKVNARVPKAFAQAFRDASGRNFGYIDYNSATDIRITTVGSNHFKFDLKKKSSE
ncbi:hypothetical protein GCM10007908_34530 [Rhizobium albus]|nr:hypothetical protein GCM10007908_34530 [Rhizobium albus]